MNVTVPVRPWWGRVVVSAALLGLLVTTGAAEPPTFDVESFRQVVLEGAAVPGSLSLLPFERFFMLPSFQEKRDGLVRHVMNQSPEATTAAAELAALGDRACLPYYHAVIDDEARPLTERLAAAKAVAPFDGSRLHVFWQVFRDRGRSLDDRRHCMCLLLSCNYPTVAEFAGEIIDATPAGAQRDELVRLAAVGKPTYREQLHRWSQDETRSAADRVADIDRLLQLGEPVVGRLVRTIVRDTKDSNVRATGLRLLAVMQDRTYQAQLQRLADDPTKPRRWRRLAVDVLALMGDESRLGWLVDFARHARDGAEARECYSLLRRYVCADMGSRAL